MQSNSWRATGLAVALALPAGSPALPQSQGFPTVQPICQPTGSQVMTVRILYTAGAVKHVHVFTPIGGGANRVFIAPALPTQIYTLAVPAGSWKMMYGTGGIVMSHYNPVIVVPPYKVTGRFCERTATKGGPAS
jgi:hypothetical protein